MASMQQAVPMYAGSGFSAEAAKRVAAETERTRRERQKQALVLQKENILSQRTSNPGRRAALEVALAHIEAELSKLES